MPHHTTTTYTFTTDTQTHTHIYSYIVIHCEAFILRCFYVLVSVYAMRQTHSLLAVCRNQILNAVIWMCLCVLAYVRTRSLSLSVCDVCSIKWCKTTTREITMGGWKLNDRAVGISIIIIIQEIQQSIVCAIFFYFSTYLLTPQLLLLLQRTTETLWIYFCLSILPMCPFSGLSMKKYIIHLLPIYCV